MKTFTQFLVEKTSFDDALKVLGLTPGFSAGELEKAHKDAVRKFHPDRNPGDASAADKMARANDARDVLKSRTGAGMQGGDDYKSRQQSYADMDAKRKAYAQVARDAAEAHLDISGFADHFQNIFGESFKTKSGWWGGDATVASYQAEFWNASRSIVLSFSLHIDYTDLYTANKISGADSGLSMSIISDILYNRKKVKLTQRNYRMENEYKVLSDPEVLFPSAKLKSQMAKDTARKLSKRDVLLTFQKELGADVQYNGNDIWVYAPVGEFRVAFYRMTMAFHGERAAMWGINGVYNKKGGKQQASPSNFVSVNEDQTSMDLLMNTLRDMQSHPADTAQGIADDLDAFLKTYKSKRGY